MINGRLKTVALIPAFNEEDNIAKVILRTKQHVDDVIVCDDGSTDMTSMIAEALGVKVVRHAERLGKGEALRTLSRLAMQLNPDVIVALDADGQHNPDDIPMLLKPIEADQSDVVVGSRYVHGSRMDAPLYRRLGLRVINYLYKAFAGIQTNDTQSGFRIYSKKGFECLVQCDSKGYGIESEQLVLAGKNGLRVMEVPISVRYKGLARTSKKSPLLHGADLILTLFRIVVERRPLMYLGLPGVALSGIGIFLGMYLLWASEIGRFLNPSIAMLMMGTLVVGILLTNAAITLNGLKKRAK